MGNPAANWWRCSPPPISTWVAYRRASALFRKIMDVIQRADSPKSDGHSEIGAVPAFFMICGRPDPAMRGLWAAIHSFFSF
jgi:hypothetical protein